MRRSTNNSEVKKVNRNRVFRYINDRQEATMPEISAALEISTPTVLTIVNELKEAGLVEEAGEQKSTGGRKAKTIAAIKDDRYAIGLDITKNHVGLVYTDLSRQVLKHERLQKPFENTQKYFQEVSRLIREFVRENQIPEEKLVGIGVSVPGIVDEDREIITNSHALGLSYVSCEGWKRFFPYPCAFLNDANAAAVTEQIADSDGKSMVYLSLSNTVGGAICYGQAERNCGTECVSGNGFDRIYTGDGWRSAEFGHMTIHPEGETCYCGKKGCLDAYCSALLLAELEDGKLERFFARMEEGSPEYREIWERYLGDLAIAVDNLRMCFDCEVVLGGYVGSFMEPYLPEFRELAGKKNIFEGSGDYIRVCRYRKEASALGAAVYQIEKYIENI